MGSELTKLAVSTISEPITTMLLIFSSSTLLASFSASETEIASNHSVKTEQISVSLLANYDSIWISWVTGPSRFLFRFQPITTLFGSPGLQANRKLATR